MRADAPPDSYRHAAILMTVAGCMNVFWGGLMAFGVCGSTFSGVLCGPICCFVPLALVPIGLWEIATARRMLAGERVPGAARVAPFMMVASALSMGFTMTMCELAATMLLHRPDVQAWLEAE